MSWFVDELFNLEQMTSEYFETNKPLSRAKVCKKFVLTPEEEEHFEESTTCWQYEEHLIRIQHRWRRIQQRWLCIQQRWLRILLTLETTII